MSSTASAVSSSHPGSGDPTPASTWLALGGCQITDQVVVLPESVVDEVIATLSRPCWITTV